jgi:hypothetical protein
MGSKKSIYIFFGSCFLCSLFIGGIFPTAVAIASILGIIFFNRGLIYTLFANNLLVKKETEKGYKILRKAYLTKTVPYVIVNGYVFLSLKFGHMENAKEGLDYLLDNSSKFKLKEANIKETRLNKALYLWKTNEIEDALEILEDLNQKGFSNSNFYGSYSCLLLLKGDLIRQRN